MQKKHMNNSLDLLLSLIGFMVLGAAVIFFSLSFPPHPLAEAQSADSDVSWTGGFGEVVDGGQKQLLSNYGYPFDPNDVDGDGISNEQENSDILPGTYGEDAYMNPNLCTLDTKGGRISMKINKGRFRQVHMAKDNDPNRPDRTIEDPDFSYGFISFRIELPNGSLEDEDVELKILFPDKVSPYARLYNYFDEQWLAQIAYGLKDDFWKYDYGDNQNPIDALHQKHSIILTIRDNVSIYDSNIKELTGDEGIIDGTWGLGVPKSSSGGRCFITSLLGRN